jgi:hypothetical protein
MCKCHNLEYKWLACGAEWFCKDCQETHLMCCAVYDKYLCGNEFGHEENHQSVMKDFDWDNSVYKSTRQ